MDSLGYTTSVGNIGGKQKIIIGAIALTTFVIVAVVLGLIPVYISSSNNSAFTTTAEISGITTIGVSKKRALLTGTNNQFDTVNVDSEIVNFFSSQGASSTVVSWLMTSAGQYRGDCTVVFISYLATNSDDSTVRAYGENLINSVISNFVARTSAGSLLNPLSYAGATVSPKTSASDISFTFFQNRPGGNIVTFISNSSQTTDSATTVSSTTVSATTASATTVGATTVGATTVGATTVGATTNSN